MTYILILIQFDLSQKAWSFFLTTHLVLLRKDFILNTAEVCCGYLHRKRKLRSFFFAKISISISYQRKRLIKWVRLRRSFSFSWKLIYHAKPILISFIKEIVWRKLLATTYLFSHFLFPTQIIHKEKEEEKKLYFFHAVKIFWHSKKSFRSRVNPLVH